MASRAVESLAQQALELSKNALLVNMRFMNAAFAKLRPLPIPGATMATDGVYLRYDPETVARTYANEPAALSRAFLHVILHNIFLHLYPGGATDAACWDAACDIVVENTIADLGIASLRTANQSRQQATIARIEAAVPRVTAEAVYRYLKDLNLSAEELAEMREPFYADDHEVWYQMQAAAAEAAARKLAEEQQATEGESTHAPAAGEGESGIDMPLPEEAKNAKREHAGHSGVGAVHANKEQPNQTNMTAGNRFADTVTLDRHKEGWKNAAYELGVQLDAYVQLWGAKGSNLSMNIKQVTRKKADYRDFLRKFARMGEHIKINDDEFDYVYYTYGLQLYDRMPLIEPLEYTEQKRIRDFVIAIDTSASTKDGLVRKFIERTYSILAQETSFFTDLNVLIIQCDAAITDVARMKNLEDLNDYVENLELKGLGGTDFRPVFDYVDAAVERGELTNLGGLIYFTDGQGRFPSRKPDYDAAFVFVEDTAQDAKVPVWAMKVTLEETAIMEQED